MVRKKYSAAILMAIMALIFVALHLLHGWKAAISEAAMHQQSATFGDYLIEWSRDTFENLQSEFWQLAVPFALLAGLLKKFMIEAYEDDLEELREQLPRTEHKLDTSA